MSYFDFSLFMLLRNSATNHSLKLVFGMLSLACFSVLHSCAKDGFFEYVISDEIVDSIYVEPAPDVDLAGRWNKVNEFAPLGFSHQSAAAYGDYAFFVTKGRSKIHMYNLRKKSSLFVLKLKGVDSKIYHCNQCSFGIDKFDSSDPFPLLYISQNAKSDKRCFLEVYRILPVFDEELNDYSSFSISLVQTVFFPAMSSENSLGNVNCAIDTDECVMYTYSRNNDSQDDNYGQCKITKFNIPDFREMNVYLEDESILSSFFVDCEAFNMQGGFVKNNVLYIGQGYLIAGYIILNIIDLKEQEILQRIDLQKCSVSWEPEGCFFYDGSVMISHTSAISTVE